MVYSRERQNFHGNSSVFMVPSEGKRAETGMHRYKTGQEKNQ